MESVKSVIDLDLSHKNESLKPIPKELILKFVSEIVTHIGTKGHNDFNINPQSDGSCRISIFTNKLSESESILDAIVSIFSSGLSKFIESETGESCKKYNRSLTMFESQVEENAVIIFMN